MIIPEDGLVFATDLEAWQALFASRHRGGVESPLQ